jgi:hypothetical protein
MNTETMSILPRFAYASGAELEVHHVPQHVITFVEQNRGPLQRAVQDQNGFRAGLVSTGSVPLNPSRWDDSEPARLPEGAISHYEDLLDEEFGIAMSRLEI